MVVLKTAVDLSDVIVLGVVAARRLLVDGGMLG